MLTTAIAALTGAASLATAQPTTQPAAEGVRTVRPSVSGQAHPGAATAPHSCPTTFKDDAGFRARAQVVIDSLAQEDLSKWRRGYFTGGDPGKYLIGAAIAKLLKDPHAADAIKFMSDNRTPNECYHFAGVGWARFLPLFGDKLPTEAFERFSANAAKYDAYMRGGGTENHRVMQFTTGAVLPWYVKGGRVGKMDRDRAIADRKAWLREYVRTLYQVGQGEWDSSTYLMFDVNGMLNIYDFTQDDEIRLLAKAALDWYLTAYALKYTDGLYCGPNQRGWSAAAAQSIADQTGYVWWGMSKELKAPDAQFRYALHAITSGYRPNQVISNIAARRLDGLPFESRNTKPNYWVARSKPEAGAWHESVYVAPQFTMGGLWTGAGGQATRFQIVARTGEGPVVFTGGSPIGRDDGNGQIQRGKFGDGSGIYDQTAQVGRTFICLSDLPADEPQNFAFFAFPAGSDKPTLKPGDAAPSHGWFTFETGDTLVAVRMLGSTATLGETPLTDKQKADNEKNPGRHVPRPIIVSPGPRTGFVVQVAPKSDKGGYTSLDAFVKALTARDVVSGDQVKGGDIRVNALDGKEILARRGKGRLEISVDGKAVDVSTWASVYDGPFVQQKDGVLTVNDGKNGFVIDFSGDLPVYRDWTNPSAPK